MPRAKPGFDATVFPEEFLSLHTDQQKMDDSNSGGVSPYLQNPVPFFNPGTSSLSDTGPEKPVEASSDDFAKIRAAVAELLVFGFHGTSLNAHARKLISMGAGGVILFSRNFRDPEQIATLCLDLKREAHPRSLLIMVDQEGGRVQRLGPPFTLIPPARVVGDTRDPQAAAAVASVVGRELRAVNVDMNLAPVVDVDSNPDNTVIGARAFGSSPARVAEFGSAYIRSLQREGVAACAKHYPGHGDTHLDSHFALPTLAHHLGRLAQTELPPFQRAVHADVAAIMVAHIVVPCFSQTEKPASMCKVAITHLRSSLLFEGVILSDCLELVAVVKHHPVEEAAVLAVEAGVDMVLVSHTLARQVATVERLALAVVHGRVPLERLVESGGRVAALKEVYVRRVLVDVVEEMFWEAEVRRIGCKEHQDVVANVVHQAAVVSGGGVVVAPKRRWPFRLW